MKRTFVLAAALSMGMASIAVADNQPNIADAPQNPLAVPFQRPQATYRFVDPGLPTTPPDNVSNAAGVSNVIYLNNCKPNGCPVTPGGDNSLTNRSSIPNQASTVAAFAYSDAVWNQ